MSFSIERYKEESRKLDIAGIDWEAVAADPLSKGDLFCLHYMMDIENHVPLYLSHLNSAKEWLTGNEKAQRMDRWMLNRVWVPVGHGVKTQEEVDALALYLFDDEQGEEELINLDDKIGRLPGLSGIKLMTRALYGARERSRKNPQWAWRLIDSESWAVAPRRTYPVGARPGARTPTNPQSPSRPADPMTWH
jgi:hypothetical protein